MKILKNPLILALDVDSKESAMDYLEKVGDLVGAVKLGPRLVNRYGADFVRKIAETSPVFIDNKYFDITSTMLSAVRCSFESGATLVTVHALSGREALTELSKLEKELNQIRPFKILAVTVLTSWNESSMPAGLQKWSVEDHVKILAQEAYDSGLRGLVCSGHELDLVKSSDMFKVVPGIRLQQAGKTNEDQKRTMDPKSALQKGASALVIGRPILSSDNPRKTVSEIIESI